METVVVLAILMIMLGMVAVDIFGRITQWRLNEDVGQFVHTLRKTAEHAIMSGQTFAVVIGFYDGSYGVYPVDENRRYRPGTAPIIEPQRLERCLIERITLEDGSDMYSGDVIMYATPQGWNMSIAYSLRDKDYRWRYVRCDRLTTHVVFDNKQLDLMEPRLNVSMLSPL